MVLTRCGDSSQRVAGRKAGQIDIEIVQMEIMPDHVHLFVKATPVNSPHYIVQHQSGYMAWVLGQEFPSFRPCRRMLVILW